MRVCESTPGPKESEFTVPEPYVPHIPPQWNGMLVLAEAQNHGDVHGEYMTWLASLSRRDRLRRLYLRGSDLGIQPWDDGSLKLALDAAFPYPAQRWAVSNAVLWSQVDSEGRNVRPSERACTRSAGVWARMLPILRPDLIVTAGRVAQDTVTAALSRSAFGCARLALRLPSPMSISRVSSMFDLDDLLSRFPEVARAEQRHPKWTASGYRRNKIFFACHAVSLLRSTAQQLRPQDR